MKAAKKHVAEINRLKQSLEKTDSKYLKRDYIKGIKTLTAELKEYCEYKGFDFNKVLEG